MLHVVVATHIQAEVWQVQVFLRPICAVSCTADREYDLNHEDPEDGDVG